MIVVSSRNRVTLFRGMLLPAPLGRSLGDFKWEKLGVFVVGSWLERLVSRSWRRVGRGSPVRFQRCMKRIRPNSVATVWARLAARPARLLIVLKVARRGYTLRARIQHHWGLQQAQQRLVPQAHRSRRDRAGVGRRAKRRNPVRELPWLWGRSEPGVA